LAVIVLALLVLSGGLGWAWYRARPALDLLQQGREAYARGQWETAAHLARERLRKTGGDLTALRLLARSNAQLGRDDSAIALFQRLGEKSLLADDLYLLGVATGRAGNSFEALKHWEKGLSVDPDHAETLHALTLLYSDMEQHSKALETARRLASCPGWEVHADVLSGTILLNRGDPAGAVLCWQRALAHKPVEQRGIPTPIVPRKDFARALLQTRQPALARRELELLLATEEDPEASWLLSRAFLQEGKPAQALAASETAGPFREENPLVPEPAPFVGSAACGKCHRTISHAYNASRHAHTLFPISDLADLDLPPQQPFPDPGQPAVTHTLNRNESGQLQQETRAEGQVFRAVVQYAVGSGHRGLTLIGRDDHAQARELRLSHYATDKGTCWDVTFLHARQPSESAYYLGQPLWEDGVPFCFGCHVTEPHAWLEGKGLLASDRGIGCEKCHGPGGNHELAVQAKFPDLAIGASGMASGAPVVQLCAQCHSMPGKPTVPDDPKSVRFQGATFTWSRCYTESKKAFDCITCHDPHRNVVTSAAPYEAVCISCHGTTARTSTSPSRQPRPDSQPEPSAARACPVNPAKGCIGCHMPKRSDAVPHSSFTDHYIRVHRE
jgi:tetratricopeptide (TPR) repeat protein